MIGANQMTAIAALGALAERGVRLPPGVVARGFAAARWPGRLEPSPKEPRLWWDGAHNESGVRRLVEMWEQTGASSPAIVVLALSLDKDAGAILSTLREGFPQARLVATGSRSERALAPERLAERAAAAGFAAETLPDVVLAVRHALENADGGTVLLTGSLFAVGEAMEAFGGAPGEML
jgi:dihydrofolate synthase/folylpolyglutamate synthase